MMFATEPRRRPFRIALDATGSEIAPVAEIRGAIEAARGDLEVLLVGDAEALEVEVLRFGGHRSLSVLDAPPRDAAGAAERALAASLHLLESRRADAVVSACTAAQLGGRGHFLMLPSLRPRPRGRARLRAWIDPLLGRRSSLTPERLVVFPGGVFVFAEPAGGALAIASAIATAHAFLSGPMRAAAVR